MSPLTPAWLAAQRRKYGFVWVVDLIVEGYDETFNIYVPGKVTKSLAGELAEKQLASHLGEDPKHIHQKGIRRDDS